MGDRVKTGNVLLDAWIDAMAPLVQANPKGTAPPPSWERMFFGNSPGGATAQFTELWSDLAQRALGVMTALGTTSKAGDPLGDALEQSFGVMGDVGGAAAEGPALLAEATKASIVLCATREAYRAFMVATWQKAFEEVTRESVRLSGEGKPVVTPAQWSALSNAVADRVFVEAFNSQAYLDVQHRLSTALADQRRSEMKFVEMFARFGHFPTRRELDNVGEEVNDLRRRVRQLERELRRSPKGGRKAKVARES